MRYYRYIQRYLPIGLFTLWSLKLLILSGSLSDVLAFAVIASIAALFHYKRSADLSSAHTDRLHKLEQNQIYLKDEISSAKISLGFKRRE